MLHWRLARAGDKAREKTHPNHTREHNVCPPGRRGRQKCSSEHSSLFLFLAKCDLSYSLPSLPCLPSLLTDCRYPVLLLRSAFLPYPPLEQQAHIQTAQTRTQSRTQPRHHRICRRRTCIPARRRIITGPAVWRLLLVVHALGLLVVAALGWGASPKETSLLVLAAIGSFRLLRVAWRWRCWGAVLLSHG